MFVELITTTILNITRFFKVLSKHFKCNIYIKHTLEQIMFGNYIASTCNIFAITMHYINAVLY